MSASGRTKINNDAQQSFNHARISQNATVRAVQQVFFLPKTAKEAPVPSFQLNKKE
jgi:hypothetical protein